VRSACAHHYFFAFLPPNLAVVLKKDYLITAFSVTKFFGYLIMEKKEKKEEGND
jgi:hypothetical protein